MNVYETNPKNTPFVAKFMSKIKPDWWSYDSALASLTNPTMTSFYMGKSEEEPVGSST